MPIVRSGDTGSMTVGGRSMLPRFIARAMLLMLAACSHFSQDSKPSAERHAVRAQLAVGYTLLYQEAAGIPKLDWLLMFKHKSSEMAQLTDDLVDYYKDLADRLQKLSTQYPEVRLDVTAMSDIEGETRKAIGKDQAKDFAPLIGKTGADLEREALLLFYDALNEQRHLTAVMLQRETDPGLHEFLETTTAQLNARHEKVGVLLNRRYFTH